MTGVGERTRRPLGRLARAGIQARAGILAIAVVAAAAVVAGCVTTQNPFPRPGSSPAAPGDATGATAARVIAALGTRGLQAQESVRPFRPVEGPLLSAAPRTILEVTIPDDPDQGFIVIYALPSTAAAQTAAEDHAAYLAAGIGGGSQYPPGTQFSVRVVGSNVVFFSRPPAAIADPRTTDIAAALATIGNGVPVGG